MAVLGSLVLGAPDPHAEPTRLTARPRGAARASAEGVADDAAPGRVWPWWADAAALSAIVAFGAWTRASGFTRGSLWFDDAWTALPARVPLATAVRMVTTAPGYTLAIREWLLAGPSSSWWAQTPAFVAGLAGIVAVFFLLRYFRAWPPLALLGALVVAASPVATDYSTRVKQFAFDLLLACLLLWLAERWRRDPRTGSAVALAVAAACSVLVSSTTLVVAVPVAAVAALLAVTDRARRLGGTVVAATTAATLVVADVLWLRHLSPSLHYGWTRRGYLLSTRSAHRVAFSFEAMGTGLLHWLVGTPTGRGRVSTAITPAGVALALLAAALLCALAVPPLVGLVRRRGREPGPLVVASLSVVLAVALAMAGRAPFGGGRTDEVLYPSLLVLATVAATPLVGRRGTARWRAATALVVAAAIALVAVGATHRAAYPTTDLRALHRELVGHVRPGDVVVVDPWLTFTWAYDGLSPTAISFARTRLAWSQGFHVVSLDPRVVISTDYFFPDRSYGRLARRADRLWYVASTVGHQSTLPGHPNDLERTVNFGELQRLGWVRAGVYLTAPHTEAILLVKGPTLRSR